MCQYLHDSGSSIKQIVALGGPLPLKLDMLGKVPEGTMNAAIKLGLNATWHELGSHSLAVGGLQSKETRKVFSTAVSKLMDRATVKSCLLPLSVASVRKAAQTSPGSWTKEPPQFGNWVPVGPQCGCWFWGSLQLITNRACRLRVQRDAAVGRQISERPGQSNADQLSESPLHFGVNILIHTMTFKYNALQKAQSKMPTGTINLSIWVMQAQGFASTSASSSWTAEKEVTAPQVTAPFSFVHSRAGLFGPVCSSKSPAMVTCPTRLLAQWGCVYAVLWSSPVLRNYQALITVIYPVTVFLQVQRAVRGPYLFWLQHTAHCFMPMQSSLQRMLIPSKRPAMPRNPHNFSTSFVHPISFLLIPTSLSEDFGG